jgi:predicted nucleic acid-binding protein
VNVVDTSGWIEYFTAGPNSGTFAEPLAKTDELVVPTLSIYEVFKWVLQKRGESEAVMAVALMQQGSVADLTTHLALEAAKTSASLSIPMADSIILATARACGATLWTQDADFEAVEGVRYVARAAQASG